MSIGPSWLTWAEGGRRRLQGKEEGEKGWMKRTDLRGLKGAGGNERRRERTRKQREVGERMEKGKGRKGNEKGGVGKSMMLGKGRQIWDCGS